MPTESCDGDGFSYDSVNYMLIFETIKKEVLKVIETFFQEPGVFYRKKTPTNMKSRKQILTVLTDNYEDRPAGKPVKLSDLAAEDRVDPSSLGWISEINQELVRCFVDFLFNEDAEEKYPHLVTGELLFFFPIEKQKFFEIILEFGITSDQLKSIARRELKELQHDLLGGDS